MTGALKTTAKKLLEAVDPIARAVYRLRRGFTRPIPPMRFRARTASRWIGRFVDSSAGCAGGITDALKSIGGPDLDGFASILDFGCGCGRTLLAWDLGKLQRLTGCDIDAAAIDWLRGAYWPSRHPNLSFELTGFDPPLPFADAAFDLVYSVSIFSHLSGEDQILWLNELARVTSPGGIALITVQGPHAVKVFAEGNWYGWDRLWAGHDLAREPFVYLPIPGQPGAEPAPGVESAKREVSYGLAFMTRSHVESAWNTAEWEVVDLFEGTVDGLQDVVALRRRRAR